MRRQTFTWLASGVLALVTAGCTDFLTGPGVDRTPNAASKVTDPGPLYVSLQAGASLTFEGQIARSAAMYDQQVAGTNRQMQGFDLYNITAGDIDGSWVQVYSVGGVGDARRVQDLARAQNDSLYIGIAKVWEAMIMGEAASVFGDVPYSQAFQPATYPTPTFDPQLTVYQEVQQQLDSAIHVYLAATPATTSAGTNQGPTGYVPGGRRNFELSYPGTTPTQLAALYTQVAHTLKARFYMHTAEKDAAAYALAKAQTDSGIKNTSGDLLFYHTDANQTSWNVWFQFGWDRGDLSPGAAIVNLMKQRVAAGIDTPDRFDYYFDCESDSYALGDGGDITSCEGYRPGHNTALPGGGANTEFNWAWNDPSVKQPVVTFAENQLIAAEAAFHAGGVGAAQPYLNSVRQNQNYGETTFPSQSIIPATLENIMEEKYIDLFLNIESWNDYKRTCLPSLAPAPASTTSAATREEIPGRLPYGLSEVNTNPNTPTGLSATGRNTNDPNACPTLNYTTSTPLAF